MQYTSIDPQFMSALGIELIEGRNFSEEITTDQTASVLINETAVESCGWTEPIGEQFILSPDQLTASTGQKRESEI